MSQHRFNATTTAGIAVHVTMGYDRILDYFFLDVQDLREVGEDEDTPADYVAYDSSYVPGGLKMGLYAIGQEADKLGIELPRGLNFWLNREREERERTNYSWFWPLDGTLAHKVNREIEKAAVVSQMLNNENASDAEIIEHLSTECTTIPREVINRIIKAERGLHLRDWQHEINWSKYLPDGA